MKRKIFAQPINPSVAKEFRAESFRSGIRLYVMLEMAMKDYLKKGKQNESPKLSH